MTQVQKISPFLWYDQQAQQAAEFYTSIFPDSRILTSTPLVTEFTLTGLKFQALNGGPMFKFTEAISFMVLCDDQSEVDYYWDNLTADGGSESMCGWLKDKYGLSWQIIPQRFMELINSGDQEKSEKVMQAMLPMRKMIIADLEKAYNS
jgi:predicted 3-demethylubiquinone-9 3-methyltransferase (glyoxalase superfamily)